MNVPTRRADGGSKCWWGSRSTTARRNALRWECAPSTVASVYTAPRRPTAECETHLRPAQTSSLIISDSCAIPLDYASRILLNAYTSLRQDVRVIRILLFYVLPRRTRLETKEAFTESKQIKGCYFAISLPVVRSKDSKQPFRRMPLLFLQR